MENYQNIEQISNQIAEKNEKLAWIFREFIVRIIEECEKLRKLDENNPKKSKASILLTEDILAKSSEDGKINVIPSDYRASCQSLCVCFAFDKWNASKGFKGVSKKMIEYWLSCSKINKGTLIFSFAWDGVDFVDNYKTQFDQYTIDPEHTVAVILYTSRGISLQYLNN